MGHARSMHDERPQDSFLIRTLKTFFEGQFGEIVAFCWLMA